MNNIYVYICIYINASYRLYNTKCLNRKENKGNTVEDEKGEELIFSTCFLIDSSEH